MKVQKRDGSIARRILTGMIVDSSVLGRIAPRWPKQGLFKDQWSNLIGGWAVQFHNAYGKAPGSSIQGLYETWASESGDKETTALVERFLGALSGEYAQLAKTSNSDYIVDLAGEFFNRVQLELLAEGIQGAIEAGQPKKAAKLVTGFGQVELGMGVGIDIFKDQEAIKRAFLEKREPLIKYSGALGNFFGDALERDGLVAIMGPEKRGKSWNLQDLAFRAILQGKRVAFFEVGDMSQNQILRRFAIRAAKAPLKPKLVKFPTSIEYTPGERMAEVEHEEYNFEKGLSWKRAWSAFQEIAVKLGGESLIRLSCHPNSTLSVGGMQSIIQSWERRGWVPDVVVVDYADILAPPHGYTESRDQINATWKGLRSLSQSMHCLVITATQTDAASYKVTTLDRSNFSEDKRKFAHVTGMFGLNVTDDEKRLGISRFNWVQLREDEFVESKCVHIAGCLALGNPTVKSTF